LFFRKLVLPALIPLQHSAENDVKGRFLCTQNRYPIVGISLKYITKPTDLNRPQKHNKTFFYIFYIIRMNTN